MGELKLLSETYKSWKELGELREPGELCPESVFVLAALTKNGPSILVRISRSTKMQKVSVFLIVHFKQLLKMVKV